MFSFGQMLLHIVLVNLPTIVPEVFARLGPSNIAKPPSINMVNHLTWRNKFCLKQCPHSQKTKVTNMLLMFDWTCLLSFAQKTTFFTERTFVWFVDCNKFVFGCGICFAVILSSKQKLMQMCISFKSASKKSHVTCKEVKTC